MSKGQLQRIAISKILVKGKKKVVVRCFTMFHELSYIKTQLGYGRFSGGKGSEHEE
jgi:hypothetical protein